MRKAYNTLTRLGGGCRKSVGGRLMSGHERPMKTGGVRYPLMEGRTLILATRNQLVDPVQLFRHEQRDVG